mgnify:CR=1 FL=1
MHVLIAFSATLVTVVMQLLPGGFIPLLSLSHGSFAWILGGLTIAAAATAIKRSP